MSFLEKYLFRSSAYIFTVFFFSFDFEVFEGVAYIVTTFANIFSYSLSWIFLLLMISFALEKQV